MLNPENKTSEETESEEVPGTIMQTNVPDADVGIGDTIASETSPHDNDESGQTSADVHPLLFCRILHQDFGSDFRVFDPDMPDDVRERFHDAVVEALTHRDPEKKHILAIRDSNITISGWLIRMEDLETDMDKDDCGRRIFGFVGVSGPSSAPLFIPNIRCISRIYNQCIAGIWNDGGLNEHPDASPFRPSEDDAVPRPPVRSKTKKDVRIYRGIIDCASPDSLDEDHWTYVSGVRRPRDASSMGANLCTLAKHMPKHGVD